MDRGNKGMLYLDNINGLVAERAISINLHLRLVSFKIDSFHYIMKVIIFIMNLVSFNKT